MTLINKGPCTLVTFFWQKCQQQRQTIYLPWPPWAMQQKIETILSLLLHRPRWPRQVVMRRCRWHFDTKLRQCKHILRLSLARW
jgi:hypothetical protein